MGAAAAMPRKTTVRKNVHRGLLRRGGRTWRRGGLCGRCGARSDADAQLLALLGRRLGGGYARTRTHPRPEDSHDGHKEFEELTRFHTVWNERASEMHVREDDIAGGHFLRSFRHPKPLNPKTLNPKPLNPKPLNPKFLSPKGAVQSASTETPQVLNPRTQGLGFRGFRLSGFIGFRV